jgi:hypothetical protein
MSEIENFKSEENYQFKLHPVEENAPSPMRELPPLPESGSNKIVEQTIDSAYQSQATIQQPEYSPVKIETTNDNIVKSNDV